jgi:hypothetical protein
MWPKMLFDLLPHFARLMPIADKYLTSRSASEKAREAALAVLAADVRGEVGKATEAQTGLLRQMQEQTTQIADLAVEVTRARMGVESVEARVGKLENSMAVVEAKTAIGVRLLGVALVLLVMAIGLLAILVIRVVR